MLKNMKYILLTLLIVSQLTSCKLKNNDVQSNTTHSIQPAQTSQVASPQPTPSSTINSIVNSSPAKPTNEQSLEKFVRVSKENDGSYSITLYDSNGGVVKKETSPKEPNIKKIGTLVHISTSLGSLNNYVYFFDTVTGKVTGVFNNPIVVEGENIVYFNNGMVIVTNMFNKDKLYKEIKRDFAPTAVPSSAILKAEFLTSNKLTLKYLEGTKQIEKTETIDL